MKQIIVLMFALACFSSPGWAQPQGQKKTPPRDKGQCHCPDMKAAKKEMQARMQEQDAAVRAKLEAVKQAGGEQRVDRMVDLLEAIVTQREKMHADMKALHEKRMECGCPEYRGGMGRDDDGDDDGAD